jgi:hypothetical protein
MPTTVEHPALDDADAEDVGHEEDRGRGALQFLEQPHDARLRAQRQRDVDLLDAARQDVGLGLGQRAQQPFPGLGIDTVVGPVVEEPGEVDASVGRPGERLGHLQAQRPGSQHHRRPTVGGLGIVEPQHVLARPHGRELHERCPDDPGQQHVGPVQVQALCGPAAQQQDRKQPEPRDEDVHRRGQPALAEAVAPGEDQREDEQAQHQVGPAERLGPPVHGHGIAQHHHRRLQECGDERAH